MNALILQANLPDVAAFLLRLVLGGFFVLARFRWVYDPSRPAQPWFNRDRHSHLAKRICSCGYGMHPLLNDLVAVVEIGAGTAVVFGVLTALALPGLLSVLLFATWCTAKTKVLEQSPVDWIDCVSDYFWRVEGVYITIAIVLLCLGPGAYSGDHLLAYVLGAN